MSKETKTAFGLGFVAMVLASFIAPVQFVWAPIVGIGILSGLVGVAHVICDKKS